MKRVAIMQPYLFPYMGYFQLIQAVNTFVLYDNLKYSSRAWVNRNRLLQVKGNPFYFTVPVVNKDLSKRKIREVEIANDSWKRKLLNYLKYNYKRSPFFDEMFYLVCQIINYETKSVSELNSLSITSIAKYLQIETEVIANPDVPGLEDRLKIETKDLEGFFPELVLVPRTDRKIIRAIALCKTYEANVFINSIGGRHLYPKHLFERNQLKLYFLSSSDIRYKQNAKTFHPRLSIIDTLMNCGREGTLSLLHKYELQ